MGKTICISKKIATFAPVNNGAMLEWLKRHAWKACKRQKRFPSSNLGRSAKISADHHLDGQRLFLSFNYLSEASWRLCQRTIETLASEPRRTI